MAKVTVNGSASCFSDMCKAIEQKDIAKIKMLLENGMCANGCNEILKSYLMKAVASGQTNIVAIFLDKGADVNARDENGDCGLRLAIRSNNIGLARLFACYSADVDARNSSQVTLFEEAMGLNRLDMMQLLVNHGCNINKLTSDSKTYLIQAMEKDDNNKQAELILEAGADVNALGYYRSCAMEMALEKSNLSYLQLLLEYNVNIHGEIRGQTFLQFAVDRNSAEAVLWLLKHKVDINKTGTGCKEPPLLRAVIRTCEASMVDLLISYNAKIDARTPIRSGHTTALMSALRTEGTRKINTDIVKALIKSGADVNQCDQYGNTPLLLAAENNLVQIVKLLLITGAYVSVKNFNMLTPLIATTSPELINLFVRLKVDVNAIGRFSRGIYNKLDANPPKLPSSDHAIDCIEHTVGLTALMKAAKCGKRELVKALIENGADVNIMNEENRSALFYATIKAGDVEILKLLISQGAEVNVKDVNDLTPLVTCLINKWRSGFYFLISKGADVNLKTYKGRPPLVYALEMLDLLHSLVFHGADVNAVDEFGRAPLHLTAVNGPGTFESMIVLVKAGAKIDQRDNERKTALMYAAERDQFKKVAYLLAYGADVNMETSGSVKKSALSLAMWRNDYTEATNININQLLDCTETQPQLSDMYRAGFHRLIFVNRHQLVSRLMKYFGCPITVTFERRLMASSRWHRLLEGVKDSLNPFSPFCSAMLSGNSELAQYFNDNWFLTQSDATSLSNKLYILQYLRTRHYNGVPVEKRKKCESVMRAVYKEPWSLAKLSFVKVSSLLGEGPERFEKVKALPLPDVVKDKLLFKTQETIRSKAENWLTLQWERSVYYDIS